MELSYYRTSTMDVSTCVKPAYDEAEMEKILLKPYDYTFQVLAYDLVPTKLSECLNNWLHVPREKLEKIKKIMRRINQSLAMFDDVLDDSLFRRNQPVTHNVFGLAMTLNTTWLAQFLAFEEILELGHPKAAQVYCKSFLTCLRGIGTNIHWRNTQYRVTQEEYNQMILNQTGGYILVMVNLMKLFSNSKIDLKNFLKTFMIYYQIRDEYVDLKKPEAVEEGERIAEWKDLPKVSFCQDFSEGKISTPVLQALNSRHRDVILGILKMRPRDFKTKEYLLSLLEEGGGIQKTRELLHQLETEMFNEIERLGGNSMLVDLIRDLQTWDERV